jgi:hypothetical protein
MPTELEQRARELLAAELDREVDSGESRNIIRIADMVREGVPVRSGFVEAALRAIAAALQAQQPASFQQRVAPWMQECFGEAIAKDVQERGDRFLEESLELLQSHGYDRARIATLVDYVYGRPAGEPSQEVGGVMVTLAAYCLATGIDMHASGETELARIWTKVEVIRAKQKSKRGMHTPLPVPEAQQPGAQAVGYISPVELQSLDAARRDAANFNATVFAKPTGQAGIAVYAQPPSIPEPSEADVEAACIAYDAELGINTSLEWLSEIDDKTPIRAALTTYTARLRERIGGGV